MRVLLIPLATFVLVAHAFEDVPHAHGLPQKTDSGIRRAPITSLAEEGNSFGSVPHARGLVKPSTGVRRAPNVAATHAPVSMKPRAAGVRLARRPIAPHPMGLLPLPMAMQPLQLPTVDPSQLPTLAPMPTLPTFTMPPSFQRLLGITTTASPKVESRKHRHEDRSDERYSDYGRRSSKELSSVGSRLPKYISPRSEVISPEKNADWIVPF